MRQPTSELKSIGRRLVQQWSCSENVRGRLRRAIVALGALALYMSSGSAYAAIGFVQGGYATPQSPQSAVAVTFASAQTAGNLNVVVVGWNDTTAAVTSVTDSVGNVYALAVGPTKHPGSAGTYSLTQSIYYARGIAPADAKRNTVTVQFTVPAQSADIRIVEYSGLDQINPLDVTSAATGTDAASNSGAVTTTNANDLIVGANLVFTHTTGPGTGFTQRMVTSPDGDIAEDRVVSAVGSYSATAPLSRSGPWIMQMVAFKAAATGGTVDSSPPTIPSNLAATAAGSGGITLTWTASSDNVGVTNYLVERCQGAGCNTFGQVATSTVTTDTDTGLLPDTSFSYRTRATDAASNLSGYSNISSATTNQSTGPANPPPPNPISFIQLAYATPQSPQLTVPVTFASAQTSGNLNVVVVGWNDTTAAVSSVTDSVGNVYALAVGPTQHPGSAGTYSLTQSIFYAKNIVGAAASANTVTVRFTVAAKYADVRILEYSGLDQVNPVDVVAAATGTNTTSNSGAATTTNANDLIFGANMVYTSNAAAGTGFVSRVITVPDKDIAEDRVVSTAGSYSAGASLTNTGPWVMQMVAFRGALTGSLPPPPAGNQPPAGPPPGGTYAYPIRIAPTGRYLVDQNGTPFPILGRTAWFITSLSEPDYKLFIDDTAAKGYNAIEFHVINHDPRGNHPPFDGTGALPFAKRLDGSDWGGSGAPDFSQPNETYWTHVDTLLAYAESKGLLCFMFPAYVGFGGGDQGWMTEMVANGSSKVQAYGTWIATRYKNQKNLVWMAGGDMMTFDANQTAVEGALLTGLKSVANQQSIYFSAEWTRGSIATDQPAFGSQMTLNGTYANSQGITIQGQRAYVRSPTIPAFLLEEPYDEEGADGNRVNLDATQPVRRFQWWGVLSNIGGYISGNGYIWPFRSGWQTHLNTQGAQDMAQLNTFISSIAWYNLVPSGLGGMKTLVVGNSSPGLSVYVAAAATPDGTLLVAYVPPDHSGSITIDITAMSGLTRARWFNPTSAAYTLIGTFANTGTRSFTPPGNNGTGFTDWVLLLEKQ